MGATKETKREIVKLLTVTSNKKKDITKNKSSGFFGWVVSLFSSSDLAKIQSFVKTTAEYKVVTTSMSRLKDIQDKWKKVLDIYDSEVDPEYEEASDFLDQKLNKEYISILGSKDTISSINKCIQEIDIFIKADVDQKKAEKEEAKEEKKKEESGETKEEEKAEKKEENSKKNDKVDEEGDKLKEDGEKAEEQKEEKKEEEDGKDENSLPPQDDKKDEDKKGEEEPKKEEEDEDEEKKEEKKDGEDDDSLPS